MAVGMSLPGLRQDALNTARRCGAHSGGWWLWQAEAAEAAAAEMRGMADAVRRRVEAERQRLALYARLAAEEGAAEDAAKVRPCLSVPAVVPTNLQPMLTINACLLSQRVAHIRVPPRDFGYASVS